MKLIVGLGNPGKEYENTRHNVGFKVIDSFANNNGFPDFVKKDKFKAWLSEKGSGSDKIILLKPETFMNLSGESVRLVANFYGIDPKDILIIHDELDFDFGRVELKSGGEGKSTHNGIRSVVENLKSPDFSRLRIGIKNDLLSNMDAADFVLSRWNSEESQSLDATIQQALIKINLW